MTALVSITLQLPSAVWDAYRRAAQYEATTPESIARQILGDACEGMSQVQVNELVEAEKAARSIA
ncbi:MAG: hypothetical protein K0Q64_1390 [Nitrobacter vulgaris]|jgi:hypothetical protein|nr:hypothetical protein [Nitrobacter vulgaris]